MTVKPKNYYRPVRDEIEIFQRARENQLPILLKGPTGCGKTRFVEFIAESVNIPLIQVSCNEDTSSADLLGRFLLKGGETVWQDGPVTRAVRSGSFIYLDEIAEAREDVVVLLHSLSDHRRELYLDRTNEVLKAQPGFQLIVSLNPGYQKGFKELKPSTRQRFVAIEFQYPNVEVESEILQSETGISEALAYKLADLGKKIRSIEDLQVRETVSTRLLIHAARLILAGLDSRSACISAVVHPLTDDPSITRALSDLIALKF